MHRLGCPCYGPCCMALVAAWLPLFCQSTTLHAPSQAQTPWFSHALKHHFAATNQCLKTARLHSRGCPRSGIKSARLRETPSAQRSAAEAKAISAVDLAVACRNPHCGHPAPHLDCFFWGTCRHGCGDKYDQSSVLLKELPLGKNRRNDLIKGRPRETCACI